MYSFSSSSSTSSSSRLRSFSAYVFGSFLIALSLSAAALAQDGSQPPPPAMAPAPMQEPAPIVRQYGPDHQYAPAQPYAPGYPAQRRAPQPLAVTSPSPGIWVRNAPGAEVKTVANNADSIELRVDKGLANITIRHPRENEQILVDLPGGQVDLFKDGVYTFNATTNTFRVLEGEAAAYPASDTKAKPLTVKEDHAVVFGAGSLRSVEFAPFQARADILPAGAEGRGEPGYRPAPGYGSGYYGPAYAYGPSGYWGPYGDGFYGYPYATWGYPYGGWGWGGYPYGFGLGFGFGGYWGGGFGRGFGGGRR